MDFSDNDNAPPFEFVEVKEHTFKFRSGQKKAFNKEFSVAIFSINAHLKRIKGEEEWKEIVFVKNEQKYITLQALHDRLRHSTRRRSDYNELVKNPAERCFGVWNKNGTIAAMPTSWFLAPPKAYDDKNQFTRWRLVANDLLGRPPIQCHPDYRRFTLRPFLPLMKMAKGKLLYCSPTEFADEHSEINVDTLQEIITNKSGEFDGWPDPVVVSYADARGDPQLKLLGHDFLQLYCTWMKVEHYQELWKQFGVSQLLHAFPSESDQAKFKAIQLPTKVGPTGGFTVSSANIGARNRGLLGEDAGQVMGMSATKVAEALWGKDYIRSKMSQWNVEWLHKVAYVLGGEDVSSNLIFGTWEANANMIRLENVVRALTQDKNGGDYEGILTPKNKTSQIARFTLEQKYETPTTPGWAKDYPWLSFCLTYQYEMKANKCPLNKDIVYSIDVDPWSIYVPLSMEPRLDAYILGYLKSRRNINTTANAGAHSNMVSFLVSNTGKPGSLPNPPLLEYNSDEYSMLIWTATLRGIPVLELPDITVKSPVVSHSSLPDNMSPDKLNAQRFNVLAMPVPQNGFVLQGKVDIFGTTIVAGLEKWIGPPPEDALVGTGPSSIERVVIPGDFRLSMLIPLLCTTPFDKIIFRNVSIYHQNYPFDKTKSIGWHFNADWVIDSSCVILYDILTKALQVNEPILSIHAQFGERLCWNSPLNLDCFILEGVFPQLTISPVSGVTLTSIGVRLLGIRGFSFIPKPHSTLSFGFCIFGTMMLDIPGCAVALNLGYEMRLIGSMVSLRAEVSGSIWEDALGVNGLLLEDVVFGTTFSTSSPWGSFAFDVSATFSYMGSEAYFRGTYAAGGQFSLTAELNNFGINELNNFFFALFGDSLTLPECDVHIGSAIISIISGQGLSISLLDVSIAGHTAASLTVTLSPSGAALSGKLSNSKIPLGDVELLDASIELSFWTTDKEKKVDFMLGGKLRVDCLDLTIEAAVHLYPGEDGVEWTVVAELGAPTRPFSVSDVVPAVKDSFVDLSLSRAVFIAASQDDPSISQLFPGYQVRKGVHVFGIIEGIPALNDLLRYDVKGLVLDAGWSKTSGFNLFVSLPAESSINLGNGIKTTPITLEIKTNPPELAVMAGVIVPVQDSTPLEFDMVLSANTIGASASAQMKGWWVKPFGIESLKIGPNVTFSMEIIYAQLVSTGTPSGLGVSGGLMVGSMEASMAMNVSEDPKRQLLYGQMKKLSISDVVTFASTVVQQDIPKLPGNLLTFEELTVYICPFGVTLGSMSYPQGFSFTADLLFFGKRANIKCTIDKAQKSIDIVGGVDNFELGPLSVRGSKDSRATLECHLGVSKQQLIVDGVVSIFNMKAQTYINIQFLPTPIFKFNLSVQFTSLFLIKFDAELLGSIHDHPSDADFSLHAELQNDILEYLAQQIIEQFEAAKVVATEGLEAAQKKVDEAQKAWEDTIAEAERKLQARQAEWESYERDVRRTNQQIIDSYRSKWSRLRGELEEFRDEHATNLEDARWAVDHVKQRRDAALAEAQRQVDDAERNKQSAIDKAQRDLNEAEDNLSDAHRAAHRAIDTMQQEVWRIENEIDGVKKTIEEYGDAPFYQVWKKTAIAGLWIEVGVLETARVIANDSLNVSRGLLMKPEYLSKEGSVRVARDALEVARRKGKDDLAAAQRELREVDKSCKAVLDEAETHLRNLQEANRDATEAIAALEAFETAEKAIYEAALAAIEGLKECGALIAFSAAKAGLAFARESSKMLEAAKAALSLAKGASQMTLSILQAVVQFGAKALNIKTIILDGTLRGFLGIGGDNARPLSALISGYVLGQKFDIPIEFNLQKPVELIIAIFEHLQNIISDKFTFTMMAVSNGSFDPMESETSDDISHEMDPGAFLAASSQYLQQRPDVLKTLTDTSEMIPMDMPRGPFSGKPMVSSLAVARKTLMLMREANGISVFDDLDVI